MKTLVSENIATAIICNQTTQLIVTSVRMQKFTALPMVRFHILIPHYCDRWSALDSEIYAAETSVTRQAHAATYLPSS